MGILESRLGLLAFFQAREKPKSGFSTEQYSRAFEALFLIFKTESV